MKAYGVVCFDNNFQRVLQNSFRHQRKVPKTYSVKFFSLNCLARNFWDNTDLGPRWGGRPLDSISEQVYLLDYPLNCFISFP